MSRKYVIFFTTLFFCFYALSCVNSEEHQLPQNKPNILLIYIDDLGYSDLGCYGEEYGNDVFETPNIDRFASEGIRFTQAYAGAPLCSPSRVALLTGKSPARMGFEFVTKFEKDEKATTDQEWEERFNDYKLIPPRYTLNLPLEEITLAEMLKESGYETGLVGKWHVAAHHKKYLGWSLTHGPRQQGFDTAIETFGSHPYGLSKEDRSAIIDSGFPRDAITEESIHYLSKKRENPFFLMVSHYYVHTPLDSRIKWLLEKYRAKFNGEASEEKIEYAAFVEMMDHYVGQLLEALNKSGLQDNTLVILTSDNGGHPNFAYNRPFRGSKWNLYEGGIRVPFLARLPGKIKAGSSSSQPIIQTDLMATFAELSENNMTRAGSSDSQSIIPFLFENSQSEKKQSKDDRSLVWHFPYYHPEGDKFETAPGEIGVEDGYISQTRPQSAIRKGKYKLIYFYEDKNAELYNLKNDRGEQNDIYTSNTEKGEELKSKLFKYLTEENARLPRENDGMVNKTK